MTFSMPDSISCSASSPMAPVRAGTSHTRLNRRPDLAGQPHAHLARRLGHIDRGDPLDHQLVLGVGNLHRPRHHRRLLLVSASCSHFACPPIESIPLHRVDRPGASVKGTEILTGVLEATVRDPSRSGPGARLCTGSHGPSELGVGGRPDPIFTPARRPTRKTKLGSNWCAPSARVLMRALRRWSGSGSAAVRVWLSALIFTMR